MLLLSSASRTCRPVSIAAVCTRSAACATSRVLIPMNVSARCDESSVSASPRWHRRSGSIISGQAASRRSAAACESCSASSAATCSSAASRVFSLAVASVSSVSEPRTRCVAPTATAATSPFAIAACSNVRDVRSCVAVSTNLLPPLSARLGRRGGSPRSPPTRSATLSVPLVDQLAVDVDEDDRLGIRRALHPDRRRHDACLEIESLPDAAGRRTIAPAARHRELVLGEPFVRERRDHVAGLCRPRLLVLGPVHLAALPKLVQPLESLHAHLPDSQPRSRARTHRARCAPVRPTPVVARAALPGYDESMTSS